MAPLIASVSARDIRFPTSRGAHGSDMHPESLDEYEFPAGAAWRAAT